MDSTRNVEEARNQTKLEEVPVALESVEPKLDQTKLEEASVALDSGEPKLTAPETVAVESVEPKLDQLKPEDVAVAVESDDSKLRQTKPEVDAVDLESGKSKFQQPKRVKIAIGLLVLVLCVGLGIAIGISVALSFFADTKQPQNNTDGPQNINGPVGPVDPVITVPGPTVISAGFFKTALLNVRCVLQHYWKSILVVTAIITLLSAISISVYIHSEQEREARAIAAAAEEERLRRIEEARRQKELAAIAREERRQQLARRKQELVEKQRVYYERLSMIPWRWYAVCFVVTIVFVGGGVSAGWAHSMFPKNPFLLILWLLIGFVSLQFIFFAVLFFLTKLNEAVKRKYDQSHNILLWLIHVVLFLLMIVSAITILPLIGVTLLLGGKFENS